MSEQNYTPEEASKFLAVMSYYLDDRDGLADRGLEEVSMGFGPNSGLPPWIELGYADPHPITPRVRIWLTPANHALLQNAIDLALRLADSPQQSPPPAVPPKFPA